MVGRSVFVRAVLRARLPSAFRDVVTVLAVACMFTIAGAIDASQASAFCRESLESQSQGPCDPNPGVPFLFWQRTCMTYRFNDQIFTRLTLLGETNVRAIFNTSFMSWSSVDCSVTTDKPFLVEQFAGTTPTSKAEFLYDAPNESIVVARTKDEWTSLADHDANALALTLLWHDKNTGQILDVDMELNTGAGAFSDCERLPCTSSNIDLQNTVTHEGGHLLGLGHSSVPGSTMEASTQINDETQKRMLKPDDIAGYCSLDLPRFKCNGTNCSCPAPPVISSKGTIKSCSCRAVGAVPGANAGGVSGLACGVLGLMLQLCRRQRQRRARRA
jgi:hypothetical protein